MDISQLGDSLRHDAVWIVFLNVLLQQAGLPVPAVPTLLLAGSLAASSGQLGSLLAAAIAAMVKTCLNAFSAQSTRTRRKPTEVAIAASVAT